MLEWEPPKDDGGSTVTAYIIEKRDAMRTLWSWVDKSDRSTKYTVHNLTEGSEFYFRVFASNKIGTSEALEIDKPVQIRSPYGECCTV